MITDLILWLIGSILMLVSGIFAGITWILPAQFFDALTWIFDKLHNVDLFVPTQTVVQALAVMISFTGFWYFIKIILWTYHLIRHGGNVKPEKIHH